MAKGPAADGTDAPQPWGLLFNPLTKMINFFPFYLVMEHRWNEIDRGKTCPIATLSTTNPTWTDLSERPATNRLSHGTAYTIRLPNISQAVSGRHFAAKAWFLLQASIRGICGGQSGSGLGFLRVLRHYYYRSSSAPYAFIHLSPTLCSVMLATGSVVKYTFKTWRFRGDWIRRVRPPDIIAWCSDGGEREDCAFWDVTPCSFAKIHKHFGGVCCLHLQGRKIF
jgi:hypothetical protein